MDERLSYRVALRQRADGERTFALCEVDSPEPPNTKFLTQVVPTDLLLRRDFMGIAETVRLRSGESFCVDPHGVWLTQDEYTALAQRRRHDEIPWFNGLPPIFAPK